MTPDDIPAGLALCRASGWNQIARDWELFLALEPDGATVAVRDGRVIGTVTTIHFASCFGWIAMVLVDPAERGRGVGRVLLLDGLATLDDVVARLDATPAGEVLYRKLGFEFEYGLKRFQREPAPFTADADGRVAPLSGDDWPDVLAIDSLVFGADRSRLLTWLADGAPEYAWVSRTADGLEGFALGRHGHTFEHIGPIIAPDAETARLLVGRCLAARDDRPFVVDAPDHHPPWQAWLRDAGFAVQRPFARMYRGTHLHPGLPDQYFASIGPEFG
jgi:GNAT superfamily N-acetyltransferase